MMAAAAAIGAVSVYAGLLVSYYLNLAAGAAITLVATCIFFVSFAAARLRRARTAERAAALEAGAGVEL
jgi:ABC-type Mn2+/Zn2+ transport system permease subunit